LRTEQIGNRTLTTVLACCVRRNGRDPRYPYVGSEDHAHLYCLEEKRMLKGMRDTLLLDQGGL
jgi:hypothetical protein